MESTSLVERLLQMESQFASFQGELSALKTNSVSGKVGNPDDSERINILEKSFTEFNNKFLVLFREVMEGLTKVEERLDEVEQYSRRNCLLIHGVEEKDGEDILQKVLVIFKEKIKVDVQEHHIDRLHRIGKPRNMADIIKRGHRPIIVKFVSYVQRNLVFSNKKNLKGCKIGVTESLTSNRLNILNSAKEKFNKSNVWTFDGKVVVLVNKNKNYISTHRELSELILKNSVGLIEPKNLRNRNKSK